METSPADPRIQQFAADCKAAGLDPLDVVMAAGIHRSAWFRWQSGKFTPNFKKWGAVQREFDRRVDLRRDAAA